MGNMERHNITADNLYELFGSLKRIKGIDAVDVQIRRFETEWHELTMDAREFAAEVKEMREQGILFLGVRSRRNYGMGKNLPSYPRNEYHIPYVCFLYRGKNLNEWEEVFELLQKKNASFDEIMIHFQVHLAMKDYFHRAGLLVFRLRQLYDMKVEIEAALALSGFEKKMLPVRVRYNPVEEDLPGY